MHGAFNDITWLEGDFGLFIVNLFDPGHAAYELSYPATSLAYLLHFY